MTATQIYNLVVRLSDITLTEQAGEDNVIVQVIRLACTRLVAERLKRGDLNSASHLYVVVDVANADIVSHAAGDSVFFLPPRNIPNSYPLFIHYVSARYISADTIIRLKYVTPAQYWRSRNIISTLTLGHPELFTIMRGEVFTDSSIPGDSTDKMELRCIFNIDIAALAQNGEGNSVQYAYWREPRFNRLFNIVEIPEAYHEDIVNIAVSLLQKGQFIYQPGMVGRSEIIPNFERVIPPAVLTTNPPNNGTTVSS